MPDNGKNTAEPGPEIPPEPGPEIPPEPITEYDKFSDSLNGPFIRKFDPPVQPIFNSGLTYKQKSDILNEYLKGNNFYFRNTFKLSEGYLYIKLAKPI